MNIRKISQLTSAILILALVLWTGAACAWQPTGALDELWDTGLLPRLRPGTVMRSFSSYDRSGGNNDGFSGQYSKLRVEDGNSVIAEMQGPGCIYRIWFTHSIGEQPGLLDRKGEHIRIYLNGDQKPALDVPLENLFDGSLAHFPKPIADNGIGGFYCYVPIPYRASCKVVIDGQAVRFYQINYATFPSADGVKDFQMTLDGVEQEALDKAVALWKDPMGQLNRDCEKRSIPVEHDPNAEPRYRVTEDSPQPILIQGITLSGVSPSVIDATEIEFVFDEPGVQGFRLPLALFFGQYYAPQPFTSLLFGLQGGVYYNRVPIVCTGGCTVQFHGVTPFQGTLTVLKTALTAPIEEMGRLAVQVNEALPVKAGVLHPFLKIEGRGHYVGTYLLTEGPKGLPYWLEGDDIWNVDGELSIHGTGSEDYFNCGWYALDGRLNGPAAKPPHGFPIYNETENTMRATAFRWHLTDPVPFEKTIDAAIEHGAENDKIADYRSVAFYYAAK